MNHEKQTILIFFLVIHGGMVTSEKSIHAHVTYHHEYMAKVGFLLKSVPCVEMGDPILIGHLF